MKRIYFLLSLLCFFVISIQAQYFEDVVYLKNGSILHGTIIEQTPNQSIKIKTNDGNLFLYNLTEVEKMTKEEVVNTMETKKSKEPKRSIWPIFPPKNTINNETEFSEGFEVGGGLIFGKPLGDINRELFPSTLLMGIHLNVGYNLSEGMAAFVNFTNFFISPQTSTYVYDAYYNDYFDQTVKITNWQLGGNLHYNLYTSGNNKVYLLGGLKYNYYKREAHKYNGQFNTNDNIFDVSKFPTIGYDIGIGGKFKILCGELTYDSSSNEIQMKLGCSIGFK